LKASRLSPRYWSFTGLRYREEPSAVSRQPSALSVSGRCVAGTRRLPGAKLAAREAPGCASAPPRLAACGPMPWTAERALFRAGARRNDDAPSRNPRTLGPCPRFSGISRLGDRSPSQRGAGATPIRPVRRLAPSRRMAEFARVLARPCLAAYSLYRLVLMSSNMRIILDIIYTTDYRSRPGEP
jgi:hypothetical protein